MLTSAIHDNGLELTRVIGADSHVLRGDEFEKSIVPNLQEETAIEIPGDSEFDVRGNYGSRRVRNCDSKLHISSL